MHFSSAHFYAPKLMTRVTMFNTDLVEDFLRCCQRYLHGDEEFLQALQQHGFACTNNEWQFTLPTLHQFLCHESSDDLGIDYKKFRQQLFDSTVNTRLRLWQAEIVIAQNVGKADFNIYVFRHQRCN